MSLSRGPISSNESSMEFSWIEHSNCGGRGSPGLLRPAKLQGGYGINITFKI